MSDLTIYAIVNTGTNLVENIVEYDAQPSTPPPGFEVTDDQPDNYIAVPANGAAIGWSYNGDGTFTAPAITVTPGDPAQSQPVPPPNVFADLITWVAAQPNAPASVIAAAAVIAQGSS